MIPPLLLWNFSENSSVLVTPPVPNYWSNYRLHCTDSFQFHHWKQNDWHYTQFPRPHRKLGLCCFSTFFCCDFFLQIILLILLAIIIGDVINIFTRNLFRGQSTCVNMSGTHFTPLGRPQKTFISPASSSFPKTNIVMIVIKASLVF